jgi:hypothetical protein
MMLKNCRSSTWAPTVIQHSLSLSSIGSSSNKHLFLISATDVKGASFFVHFFRIRAARRSTVPLLNYLKKCGQVGRKSFATFSINVSVFSLFTISFASLDILRHLALLESLKSSHTVRSSIKRQQLIKLSISLLDLCSFHAKYELKIQQQQVQLQSRIFPRPPKTRHGFSDQGSPGLRELAHTSLFRCSYAWFFFLQRTGSFKLSEVGSLLRLTASEGRKLVDDWGATENGRSFHRGGY